MKIVFTRTFEKQYQSASTQIKESFEQRLNLFLKDKYTVILNNHTLRGKFKEYRSINITGDWRAIFRESKDGSYAYFILLGKHSELYK